MNTGWKRTELKELVKFFRGYMRPEEASPRGSRCGPPRCVQEMPRSWARSVRERETQEARPRSGGGESKRPRKAASGGLSEPGVSPLASWSHWDSQGGDVTVTRSTVEKRDGGRHHL